MIGSEESVVVDTYQVLHWLGEFVIFIWVWYRMVGLVETHWH